MQYAQNQSQNMSQTAMYLFSSQGFFQFLWSDTIVYLIDLSRFALDLRERHLEYWTP